MFYIFCRKLHFFNFVFISVVSFVGVTFEAVYSSYISKAYILEGWWYIIGPVYAFCLLSGLFFFIRGKELIPLMDSLKGFVMAILTYATFFVFLWPLSFIVSKGIGGMLLDIEGGIPYTEEFKCGGSGRNKILGEYIYVVDKDGRSKKLYGFGRVCSNGWFGKDNTVLRATGRENDFVKSVETLQVVHH